MRSSIATYFILAFILVYAISCSKSSSSTPRSARLTLLQNKWSFNSSGVYDANGVLLFWGHPSTYTTYDFNADGNIYVSPSSYSPFASYTLLSDDSTLIITRVSNAPSPETNFISLLNNNQLIFHYISPSHTNAIDSLTR
jgi:hypothetical protein